MDRQLHGSKSFWDGLDLWYSTITTIDIDKSDLRLKSTVDDFEGLDSWYHSMTSCQIALFGNEGCGKTCTARDVNEWLGKQPSPPAVCAFFPPHDCAKTATELYSTIVYKLLYQERALFKLFSEFSCLKAIYSDCEPLGKFLEAAIPKVTRDVIIIIDSFDGYDAQSQHHIYNLFTSLMPTTHNLKLLWTSRPTEQAKLLLENCTPVYWTNDEDRNSRIIQGMMMCKIGMKIRLHDQTKLQKKFASEYGGNLARVRDVLDQAKKRNLDDFKSVNQLIDEMNHSPPSPRIGILQRSAKLIVTAILITIAITVTTGLSRIDMR